MTHIYLIRHGESFPNVEPIVGGMRGDRGLTPRGVTQAERLRDRLAATKEIQPDVVIVSTLPRARQTAEIIAPALGRPLLFDDDVQELRPGEADGMQMDEAWAKYGTPNFQAQPFRPMSPGGEGWAQFMLRVGATLDRIAREQHGKTVVIVCHGGFIDGSFMYYFGMDTLRVPKVAMYTRNTSLTYWQYLSENVRQPHWRLVYYNDATHLRDMEPQQDSIRWEEVSPKPESGSDKTAVPLPTEDAGAKG